MSNDDIVISRIENRITELKKLNEESFKYYVNMGKRMHWTDSMNEMRQVHNKENYEQMIIAELERLLMQKI